MRKCIMIKEENMLQPQKRLQKSHNYFINIETEAFQDIQSQIAKEKCALKLTSIRKENEKQRIVFLRYNQ